VAIKKVEPNHLRYQSRFNFLNAADLEKKVSINLKSAYSKNTLLQRKVEHVSRMVHDMLHKKSYSMEGPPL